MREFLGVSVFVILLVALFLGFLSYTERSKSHALGTMIETLRADLSTKEKAAEHALAELRAKFGKDIAVVQKDNETLKATLQDLAKTNAAIEQEKKALAADNQSLRTLLKAEQGDVAKLVESLRAQVADLTSQVKRLIADKLVLEKKLASVSGTRLPDVVVDGVADFNKYEFIDVGYRTGKKEEAIALCKQAGFVIEDVREAVKAITCRRAKPMTEETLRFFAEQSSTVTSVSPQRPVIIERQQLPPVPSMSWVPDEEQVGLFKQQWGLHSIKVVEAWKATTSSTRIVAVIDGGVDYTHEDLKANMWRDGKGNLGYDWASENGPLPAPDDRTWWQKYKVNTETKETEDADPLDLDGHGTHVAGIIGGTGNNGVGIVGVNWRARIMALKVFRELGDASPYKYDDGTQAKTLCPRDAISAAIYYAVDNGAHIINCSFRCSPDTVVRDALKYASDKGVLIVCAAGNTRGGGINVDANRWYPGDYADVVPSMIVVCAMGPKDQFAENYSNYGKQKVHIGAPGGLLNGRAEDSILSTWAEKSSLVPLIRRASGGYHAIDGTSMATPFVAGAAALVWSHPEWHKLVPDAGYNEAVQIKNLLLARGRLVAQIKDKCSSGRVLDLEFLKALRPKPDPQPVKPPPPSIAPPPELPVVDVTPKEAPTYPDLARTLFATGYSHFWRRDVDDSAKYFRAAVFKDPGHPGPYYYLAFTYACKGEDERATNYLKLAFDCEDRFPFSLGNEPYYRGFDTLNHWGLLMENVQGRKRFNLEEARDMHQAAMPYSYSLDFWEGWRRDLKAGNWPHAMSRRTGP